MELELKIRFESMDEMRNFIGTREAVLEVTEASEKLTNPGTKVKRCKKCRKLFLTKDKESKFCSKKCADPAIEEVSSEIELLPSPPPYYDGRSGTIAQEM